MKTKLFQNLLMVLASTGLLLSGGCADEQAAAAELDIGRDPTGSDPCCLPATDAMSPPVDAGAHDLRDASAASPDAASPADPPDTWPPLGSLIDAAGITPVVAEAGSLPLPVCARSAGWSGPRSFEPAPGAGRLLAVAASSGAAVYLPLTDGGAVSGAEQPLLQADAQVEAHARVLVVDGDVTTQVDVPIGFDPNLGVAISPDGLHLVWVSSDRSSFATSSRAEPGAAFELGASDAFVRINAHGLQGGLRYSSPVWSASGARLYVSEGRDSTNPLQLRLMDGLWAVEVRLDQPELQGVEVTSAARDDLTLFLWDESVGSAEVRWRSRLDLPFEQALVLEVEARVHVDDECTAVRYQGPCEDLADCELVVVPSSE